MPAKDGIIIFHSGALFVEDTAANSTPRRIGTLQDTQFDFKGSNKELFGENQFAEAVGRGSVKITGKAKNGRFSAAALNDLFFKQTLATGAKLFAFDEQGTVATAAITVANAANFSADLGVVNKATGVQYIKVASAPAALQYSVSAGVYTFNASENGNIMQISYMYTSATGKTMPIVNQLAGVAPTFKGRFMAKYQTSTLCLTLNACVCDSIGFGFKLDDFSTPDFSFMAQDDGTGTIGELTSTGV